MFRSALIALCLTASPGLAADLPLEGEVFTFGIVPQQSASRLAEMWGPFLSELSAQTGATFQFRTTRDIPTFEACLTSRAYDIAYMNPMHYAIFSQEPGYEAIARQSDVQLRGVIVARIGSEYAEISDLDGETLAFPSPGAFGASILNRALLSSEDIEFSPSYVSSHDSVYRSVAAGLMAAGGGVTRTFNSVDPEIRAQLAIIHETEGYTPHAIAVSDQIADDQAGLLQQALLDLGATHPALVEGIGMRGFEIAHDSDWDDVRALEMSRAETGILQQGDVVCPLN